jgi:hypothetical protein
MSPILVLLCTERFAITKPQQEIGKRRSKFDVHSPAQSLLYLRGYMGLSRWSYMIRIGAALASI